MTAKGFWFWIVIRDKTIEIIFSGITTPISVTHPCFGNLNDDLFKISNISDTPFTIKRGLVTKNLHDTNSKAYQDIRQFERSQGKII